MAAEEVKGALGLNCIMVEIWTEKYRITGKLYAPTGAGHSWRFSDMLNKPDRAFLPVTDVTVFSLEKHDIVWRKPFLAINKDSIVLATGED